MNEYLEEDKNHRVDHCLSCGGEMEPQIEDKCILCGAENVLISTFNQMQYDLEINGFSEARILIQDLQELESNQRQILSWCGSLEEAKLNGEFEHKPEDSYFLKQVKTICQLATMDIKDRDAYTARQYG